MAGLFSLIIKFFRWSVSLALILILIVTSLVIIPVTGVAIQLTNRDNPKAWVKQSGLYERRQEIILQSLDEFLGSTPFATEMKTRLQNPEDEMTKLIDTVITPQFMEKSVNNLIDGVYDWLSGKNPKIETDIRLFQNKQEFTELATVLLKERIRSLPDCDFGNLPRSLNFDNPFSMTCRPPGFEFIDVDQLVAVSMDVPEVDELYNQLQFGEQSFEPDPKLSEAAPKIYLVLVWVPLLYPLYLALLLALIVWIMPVRKKKALIATAVTVAIAPIAIVISVLTAGFYLPELNKLLIARVDPATAVIYQEFFMDMGLHILGSLLNSVAFYALGVLIFLSVCVVGSLLLPRLRNKLTKR